MITGLPLRSEPTQEKWFQVNLSKHKSLCGLVGWLYLKHFLDVMTSLFSTIKWRQRPDMTLAVDWDVKHQYTETNRTSYQSYSSLHRH